MAANTINYGSTVPSDQNFSLTDAQRGQFRVANDGTYPAETTPACDFSYQSLTASGNTLVKTGIGNLRALITSTATGNVTIYDGINSSGVVILAASALVVGTVTFEITFGVGLFIVLSGAGVATVTFR